MTTATLARRLSKLERAEARHPRVYRLREPSAETLRGVLRILIDIGALELDDSTLRWKKHYEGPTARY